MLGIPSVLRFCTGLHYIQVLEIKIEAVWIIQGLYRVYIGAICVYTSNAVCMLHAISGLRRLTPKPEITPFGDQFENQPPFGVRWLGVHILLSEVCSGVQQKKHGTQTLVWV